ncbi:MULTISPECIES: DUF4262 domain-containing protein [Mycolicibacterium]|uniref:DUF4262 domain-containing protein n=1 Tax=Mycolicibacterium alvei TaxID=67081 RepID=A0A6N4UZI1_9MYCO|nr:MULTISPECIES: DUF4262 domain-containing protein [Mycolicibacterium]MCV7003566.1 DUF4262 domain-containing protein [Mycolicibacterium alvei]BBX30476.1 hypothetical protein MALV_56010 [Mycolicibacterium alvei]
MSQDDGVDVKAFIAHTVQRLRFEIAENGWTTVAVLPTAADPDVRYVYTVGLTTIGQPELAIYGVPASVAKQLLDTLARRLIDRGAGPAPGERFPEVVGGGLELAAMPMTDSRDLLLVNCLYAQWSAVQIVWPDAAGRLPWEPGCALSSAAQPLRGTAPAKT